MQCKVAPPAKTYQPCVVLYRIANFYILLQVLELPDDHVMPVGLPNMYTQIKITNRQSGDPVGGPEEQGEICVRSPQNFVGYLHCPDNKTVGYTLTKLKLNSNVHPVQFSISCLTPKGSSEPATWASTTATASSTLWRGSIT